MGLMGVSIGISAKPVEIRPLTNEEQDIYAGSVVRAIERLPSFRDIVALLNPYFDSSAETVYVDKYARMGIGPWFFDQNPFVRASAILHEASHILNNHFLRAENLGSNDQPDRTNIAQDFEINCGLREVSKIDLDFGVHPDRGDYNFKPYLTFEQYFHLLPEMKNNGNPSKKPGSSSIPGESDEDTQDQDDPGNPLDGNSGGSSGKSDKESDEKSKNGSPCDRNTEERSKAADDANIERASEAEVSVSKQNAQVRIEEQIRENRAAGKGAGNRFLQMTLDQMAPPKVNWAAIFRRVVSRISESIIRGRSDYSYRRISKRLNDREFIFPGMVKYIPTAMIGVDTSGSMTKDDYMKALSEIEGIIKKTLSGKSQCKIFTIDTSISKISTVSSVKELDLYGGGGTAMEVAWKFIQSLPKKEIPDIFVLCTDGGTDWNAVIREIQKSPKKIKSVILVTSKYGMETVPQELNLVSTVIDLSEEFSKK